MYARRIGERCIDTRKQMYSNCRLLQALIADILLEWGGSQFFDSLPWLVRPQSMRNDKGEAHVRIDKVGTEPWRNKQPTPATAPI